MSWNTKAYIEQLIQVVKDYRLIIGAFYYTVTRELGQPE